MNIGMGTEQVEHQAQQQEVAQQQGNNIRPSYVAKKQHRSVYPVRKSAAAKKPETDNSSKRKEIGGGDGKNSTSANILHRRAVPTMQLLPRNGEFHLVHFRDMHASTNQNAFILVPYRGVSRSSGMKISRN